MRQRAPRLAPVVCLLAHCGAAWSTAGAQSIGQFAGTEASVVQAEAAPAASRPIVGGAASEKPEEHPPASRPITAAAWQEKAPPAEEPESGRVLLELGPDGVAGNGDDIAGNWPPFAPALTSISLPPADAPLPRPADPPEKPKEKAWYEKYRLRGYAQFRINHTPHHEEGTATAQHPGDSSVGARESFLIRRARLIFSADVSDHLFVYLQPEFAATVPGSTDAIEYAQIRDWYGDVYFDKQKVFRVRVGQSKVPYGWENLQSSSNRLPLDRNDAFNSATRNERDLGAFFYWTPVEAQELFEELADKGLKHSGNYGIFGIGVYNGQGGSFREENDNVHLVARLTWPWEFANGQVVEASLQGLTGEYVVLGAPIRPLGLGAADAIPLGTRETGQTDGHLDQRLGWSFIWYPQPVGFQAEWTIGRGPELNEAQTAIERGFLHGGYVMLLYRLQDRCGDWFPYVRWQYFEGGYRSFRNAPRSEINEVELGVEWQIRKELELTLAYAVADRTNLDSISSSAPVSQMSYRQFEGHLFRVQLQINY